MQLLRLRSKADAVKKEAVVAAQRVQTELRPICQDADRLVQGEEGAVDRARQEAEQMGQLAQRREGVVLHFEHALAGGNECFTSYEYCARQKFL